MILKLIDFFWKFDQGKNIFYKKKLDINHKNTKTILKKIKFSAAAKTNESFFQCIFLNLIEFLARKFWKYPTEARKCFGSAGMEKSS